MFEISQSIVKGILQDYGVIAEINDIIELQRYHYEKHDPNSKEVRLIVKVILNGASPVVIRFKNENDVTLDLIEQQAQFAETLLKNGIITPKQYKVQGVHAKWYSIGGYDVIVTVEQFVENEIKIVTPEIAAKTGQLLAKMHKIAEQNQLHVNNGVLFDPFASNDLFAYDKFLDLEPSLDGECKELFGKIVAQYDAYMEILAPLKKHPRYAVQGDISDCNLYLDASGEIGVFDFNRCGDNILYCDAVMQAIFEARLMDYPEEKSADYESQILAAFWKGYHSIHPFSEEEQRYYPYLYTIIDAFWSFDLYRNDDSLFNAHKANNTEGVRKCLSIIYDRITQVRPLM